VFNSELAKWLALAAMVASHAGAVLAVDLPSLWLVLWAVGRVCLPIFCILVAVNVDRSRDPVAYGWRLALWGVVAQVPWMLLGWNGLNVLMTLAFGVAMVGAWRRRESFVVSGLLLLAVAEFIVLPRWFDGGFAAVLLIVAVYRHRHLVPVSEPLSSWDWLLSWCLIVFAWFLLVASGWASSGVGVVAFVASLWAVPVLVVSEVVKLPRLPVAREFFYAVYPAHLALLFVLRMWFL
jgi:hypothetical protein